MFFKNLKFVGCTEKKIWMMIRHGTRFPNKKDIKLMKNDLSDVQEKIIKKFEKNHSELSSDFIRRLSKWKFSVKKDQAQHLTEEGENELIDLAERMQSRFPTLFVDNYKKELFKVTLSTCLVIYFRFRGPPANFQTTYL